jgi:hypothetical protein
LETLIRLYAFLGIPGIAVILLLAAVGLYFAIPQYRKWESLQMMNALRVSFKKQGEKPREKPSREQILKRINAAREARAKRQQELLNAPLAKSLSRPRKLSAATQ